MVLHQLRDLSIKLISTHRCMNIPFVGKPAIGPSLLVDDDDDDVCAVCTADLIHLERERGRAPRVMAIPNLVSPPSFPSLPPSPAVGRKGTPHSDSLFPTYPNEGS